MTRPALTPGEHGGGKPKSETALVFPWLVPQPQPEPEPEVTSVTPMVNIVSSNPPPTQQPAPTEQSGGQASSSDSGKQGSTDFSQAEDSTAVSQATEETKAQAAPSDIDELEDEFDTYYGWIPGVSVDQRSNYSSPDVMRVKQDIETRPLIFQHCFQHSASLQDAMERIYAFPPNCNEDELRHLEQIADQKKRSSLLVAMAGDSDAENAGDFRVPYGSLVRYEEHLEEKYGFQITWGKASDRTNMAVQLDNLEKAIGYILNYLAKEVHGDEHTALEAFKMHFSRSELGQLHIHLGANSETGAQGTVLYRWTDVLAMRS